MEGDCKSAETHGGTSEDKKRLQKISIYLIAMTITVMTVFKKDIIRN